MAKTLVTITARDPNGVMAAIHLETEENWMPLDVRDLDKMKDFRPSQVDHLVVAGPSKGGYTYDSSFGTMVMEK
jgi:hypothetical protein